MKTTGASGIHIRSKSALYHTEEEEVMYAMIPKSRDYEDRSRSLNTKMYTLIYIFQQPYKIYSFNIISFQRPLCYPEEAGITSVFDDKS